MDMEDGCQLLVFRKECFLDNNFIERHLRQLKNIINLGYQKMRNKYKIINVDRMGDEEDFLEEMGITDGNQDFYFFAFVGPESMIESLKRNNCTRSSRMLDAASFDIPAQYVDRLHRSVDAKVDLKFVDKDDVVSENEQDRIVGTVAIRTPPERSDGKSGAFVIQLTAITSFLRGGGQKMLNLVLKYVLDNEKSPFFREKLKNAGYECLIVEAEYVLEHDLLNFYRKCGFTINTSKLVKTGPRGKILDPAFTDRITATSDFHIVYIDMIIDL